MKFHINKQGIPAPCKATERPCPLGGEDIHFKSKEDAQNYVDNKNKEEFGLINKEKPPKKKKLNSHQLEAGRLIQNVMSDMVAGCENQVQDYEEGSEEWNSANDFLNTERSKMVELLYNMVIEESQSIGNSKHINFAGTDFIKGRINQKLNEWGY